MKRVAIHRPGGYDRLVLEEARDPAPTLDEVRVRVRAIGVNYADCVVRMGLYRSAREFVGWPIVPGFEVAGEIDAIGSSVRDAAIGDRVLAVTRFGGYATHVVVPRHQVFAIPRGMSVEEAAAFPTVFLTAHHALHGLARVRAGDVILVHSAAGGVGGALVQLGKRAGCRVIGVVGSAAKLGAARALGCDEAIVADALWERARAISPRGYDVICDANGAATLRQSYEHLASPGKLVVYGFHSMLPRSREGSAGRPSVLRLARGWLATPRFDPLDMTSANKSVLALNLSYLVDRRDLLEEAMRDLIAGLDAGELRAPPITRFPLSRAGDAHRALESRATIGKLVLLPGDQP